MTPSGLKIVRNWGNVLEYSLVCSYTYPLGVSVKRQKAGPGRSLSCHGHSYKPAEKQYICI